MSSFKRLSSQRLADQLIKWYCAAYPLEEVLVALQEEYAYRARRVRLQKACLRYWRYMLGLPVSLQLNVNRTTPQSIPFLSSHAA